jgi:hypothetical protein
LLHFFEIFNGVKIWDFKRIYFLIYMRERKVEGLGSEVQMFPPPLDFSRSARRLSTGYGGQTEN